MKLIRAVERAEVGARKRKASRAAAGRVWGLAWSESEEVLGRELAPGEYLAVDVYQSEEQDVDGVRLVSTRERVSCEATDRGLVYRGGAVIGRVEVSPGGGRVLTISAEAPPPEIAGGAA